MTKNIFNRLVILLGALLLIFVACRKTTDPPATDSSAAITTAKDQSNVAIALNQMAEEADLIVSRSNTNDTLSLQTDSIISGILRIDSLIPGTYIITYDGITPSASGNIRKGADTLIIHGQWDLANSFIESHYDYTILNIDSSKTLRLQGIDTITNINGGNYYSLLEDSSKIITLTHIGTTTITFDDGTIRTWRHSIQKTSNCKNGIITSTVNGNGTPNGLSMIEAWGINRRGENFYGQTTSPLIYNYYAETASNTCPTWTEPISGVYVHKGTPSGLTITYGVTVSGNENTLPFDTCPYGYKLNWTFGKSHELTLIY